MYLIEEKFMHRNGIVHDYVRVDNGKDFSISEMLYKYRVELLEEIHKKVHDKILRCRFDMHREKALTEVLQMLTDRIQSY